MSPEPVSLESAARDYVAAADQWPADEDNFARAEAALIEAVRALRAAETLTITRDDLETALAYEFPEPTAAAVWGHLEALTTPETE